MSGSDWEAVPDVREWSGGPPGCPGVVKSPSWMSESDRKAHPNVREWSGGPPGCLRVVGRPFRISRRPFRIPSSGRLALP